MKWKYQIIKETIGDSTFYSVHEVFYDDEKRFMGMSGEPDVVGDSKDEIFTTLGMMISDCARNQILEFDGKKVTNVEYSPEEL